MRLTSWERYWFRPAPYFDLAVVRIVGVGTQLCLLSFWSIAFGKASSHLHTFANLDALPDQIYNPITALRFFLLPLGVDRPGFDLMVGGYYVTIVAGLFALVGLCTRTSLSVFALGNIFEVAYVYSFGDVHHTQAPLFIALLLLAIAPSGRALSIDALLRRRRGRPYPAEGPLAAWPILLLQWLFCLIYLSALLSKLVFVGGLDWVNGYTLQYYLIQDSLRKGTLLGCGSPDTMSWSCLASTSWSCSSRASHSL